MKKISALCRAFCLATALAATAMPSAPAGDLAGEVLTNADVMALVEAGLAPELIRSKIEATPGVYDLSSRAMILLKQNNVPDEVVAAMMAAAEQPGSRPALDAERYRVELENIAYGSPSARTAASAWMLANGGATFPALRQSLADPRAEIRSAAVTVLARAGDRDSLPAIRNLLADSSTIVRGVAAQALVEMNDTSAVAAAEQAVLRQVNPVDGYARVVGYARLTQSAAALGEVLARNPDAVNRVAAAWALGEIGRPGVAGRAALESALFTDPDPDVRREAAAAIAKFHDAESAKLLEAACRQDPEVRKVSLAAMAEYPETMAFLISVMGLGADQIAADELETARASLVRLTGQDFGHDGGQWADWYAANYQRFAQATPPLAAPVPGAPRSATPEVDVMSWGIVADSAAIPMDPMVEAAGLTDSGSGRAAPAAGIPALTGFAAYDGSAAVAAPSAGSGGGGVPSAIPDFDWGEAGASSTASAAPASPALPGAAAGAPVLRTWSSDPDRVAGASATPAASADDDWQDATPPFGMSSDLAGGDGLPAAPAPAAPAAAPAASALSLRPPPEELTGISLPIPPLGGDDDWSAGPAAAPGAPTGDDSFAAMATPVLPGTPTAPSDPAVPADAWSPPGFTGIDGHGAPDAEAFAASPLPDGFEQGGDETLFQAPSAMADDAWTGDLFAAPPASDAGMSAAPAPLPDGDAWLYGGSDDPPAAAGDGPDAMSGFMPALPGMADDQAAAAVAAPGGAEAPLSPPDGEAAPGEQVIFDGTGFYAGDDAPSAPETAEAPGADEAPAAPDTTAADDDAWSIFVEPEPGQVVIGEPILPGQVVVEHPQTPTPAVTTPAPAVTAAATPPAVPTPTPAVTSPAPSPAVATPAPVAEKAPRRGGIFSRRDSQSQPRVDAVTGASLPKPAPVVSMPPAPVVETPPERPVAEAPAGSPPPADGSHTVFGNAGSLPPVNPEGLVTPRSGQGQPPMLGEGLF